MWFQPTELIKLPLLKTTLNALPNGYELKCQLIRYLKLSLTFTEVSPMLFGLFHVLAMSSQYKRYCVTVFQAGLLRLCAQSLWRTMELGLPHSVIPIYPSPHSVLSPRQQ